MAAADEHLRCACPHCGGHIEFPAEWAGTGVDCPHCGLPLNLVAVEPVEENPAATPAGSIDAGTLAAAFSGRFRPRRAPFSYRIALVLVAATMLVLPVLYVGFVGLVGWGGYAFVAGWIPWANRFTGGANLMPIKVIILLAGLFVAVFVLFFLVKPLFARRGRQAQPLALNSAAEPLLFAFIHMVADAVGAPTPARIDVDCRLNASAGLRGGIAGMAGRRLVLTLGLPLVATLTLRQLAGVAAHEFAHFNQGFALRASSIIRSVNGWLAHLAYDRDAWDEALENAFHGCTSLGAQVILGAAQFGVWLSRAVLKVFLHAGHAVSCLLLRQMERDADRCQVEVAGSDAFVATFRRIHVLGEVTREYYRQMRVGWTLNRRLPDNIPAALAAEDASLPDGKRTRLVARQLEGETRIFDTHPTDRERLDSASALDSPGLFHLDLPARLLFVNFQTLARQVTILHYEDDLGLPRELIQLVPVGAE